MRTQQLANNRANGPCVSSPDDEMALTIGARPVLTFTRTINV
jgi:hypothetical protein